MAPPQVASVGRTRVVRHALAMRIAARRASLVGRRDVGAHQSPPPRSTLSPLKDIQVTPPGILTGQGQIHAPRCRSLVKSRRWPGQRVRRAGGWLPRARGEGMVCRASGGSRPSSSRERGLRTGESAWPTRSAPGTSILGRHSGTDRSRPRLRRSARRWRPRREWGGTHDQSEGAPHEPGCVCSTDHE